MPTTRQIALAAGVSQSTAARALINDPRVAAETRERVQGVAASMGYKPNPLISTLMAFKRQVRPSSERYVMGYLTSDTKRDAWRSVKTFTDFYEGAAERAASYGFELEEFWLGEPRMTGHRMSQILYSRNIKGILIAPLRSDIGGKIGGKKTGMGHVSLDWSHFSAATVGYSLVRPRIHRAAHNYPQGMRMSLRQLMKLGYRRIGLALHSIQDRRVDQAWSTGFAKYLLSQRPSARTTPFLHNADRFTPREFNRWLQQQRPEVVIAGHGHIYDWMIAAGLRIPEDVGFVLLDLGSQALPDPAGIDQNSRAVAAAAVDLVVGQLHRNERGLPELPKTTLIDGFWSNGSTIRNLA
jgi:LacI family transcriptional regulator